MEAGESYTSHSTFTTVVRAGIKIKEDGKVAQGLRVEGEEGGRGGGRGDT